MAAFNPSMRGLTSVPACAAFKTSIAWFCSALPESVHAFRSSADFAPVRTRSPRSSPAPREVPSSALVLSSSFCALSLSSSALLLPTKLKMPKTSRMTATTANTIVVMRNTFVPPRFGGAPPGVGGGPGGGPGGGAKGGGPAGGGLGVVGGGCGGVVAMRGLPSCRVVRAGLCHTLEVAYANPRVRCARSGEEGRGVTLADVTDRGTVPDVAPRSRLLRNGRHVLRTSNPPAAPVDPVSRWLVLTRASVLPMTITAAAIAGLLAAFNDETNNWVLFALAAVGLVLAHVANNLMNDLFDLQVGADSDTYPRALYAPHPVLSGTITRRGLLTAALAVNAADLVILVVLFAVRGWPMIAFALGGFLLSVA